MVIRFFYLSSLNVVLATGVCCAAFMKLSGGSMHWISLIQIMLSCWLIYILDRLFDVIYTEKPPVTEIHQFHFKNQYNLQVLAIALTAINLFLLFFQSKEILVFGGVLITLVALYLRIIVPKFHKAKDFIMPIIYTIAVTGVAFIHHSSINLSAWVLAVMFLIIVYQNILGFYYFQNPATQKRRKTVNYLAAVCVFIYVILFTGSWEYPNQLALVLTLISVAYSLITSNENRFRHNFRWVMDGLLFLPVFIL
jgi:hypothetical protein